MPLIKFDTFKGEWPRVAGAKLPEGYASKAVNTEVSSGLLRGLPAATASEEFYPGTRKAIWLENGVAPCWNEDANAVQSPVPGNARFYWTQKSGSAVYVSEQYSWFRWNDYYRNTLRPAAEVIQANPGAYYITNDASITKAKQVLDEYGSNWGVGQASGDQKYNVIAAHVIDLAGCMPPAGPGRPYQMFTADGVISNSSVGAIGYRCGVPAPTDAPFLNYLNTFSPVAHLIAGLDLYVANERTGGALTEVCKLQPSVGLQAGNYSEAPDSTMQSALYNIDFVSPDVNYFIAMPGPNRVTDILRPSFAYFDRSNNAALVAAGGKTATWYADIDDPNAVKGKLFTPTPFGVFWIGGKVVESSTIATLPDGSTITSPMGVPKTVEGGIEVTGYYADNYATYYFKLPKEAESLAAGDYISGVIMPYLSVNANEAGEFGTFFDPITKTVKNVVGASVNFQRCRPRDNEYRSNWFFCTAAYYAHPSNTKRQTGILVEAKPPSYFGTLRQYEDYLLNLTTFDLANYPESIAYQVSLTPVIANDTDGPGGLDSVTPVVFADIWLAEREQVVKNSSGQFVGSITDTVYGSQDGAVTVNSDWIDAKCLQEANKVAPALFQSTYESWRNSYRSKLTKVRAIFRLVGTHTIPEQLSVLTANLGLRGVTPDSVKNNTEFNSNQGFDLSLQAKYAQIGARSYVHTFVNIYGEEGPPSAPYLITDAHKDAIFPLLLQLPLWDNERYAPIERVRLYRTATGVAGTEFLLVREYALHQTYSAGQGVDVVFPSGGSAGHAGASFVSSANEYIRGLANSYITTQSGSTFTTKLSLAFGKLYLKVIDNLRDDELAEPLSTQNYYPAPAYSTVKGLVQMHNGMQAFFEGKNVWISEPYLPYAYDPSAVQTLTSEVTGICATENYLFVATRGEPFILGGNTPQTITNQRVPALQAGVSKNSVINVGESVIYASTDGLVTCRGLSVSHELSSKLFTRPQWLAAFPGQDIDLAVQDNFLIISCRYASGDITYGKAMVLDLSDPGAGVVRYSEGVIDSLGETGTGILRSTFTNPYNDRLYLSYDNRVEYFMAGGTRAKFRYQTRRVEVPTPTSFAVLQIIGNGTVSVKVMAFLVKESTEANTGADVTYLLGSATAGLTMTLATKNWVRLPAVGVARSVVIEVVGEVGTEVFSINLASSMQELKHG